MNKTDKEYIDAQISSIDKKYEACINDIVNQMGNQCNIQPNDQEGTKYPIGFVVKDGKTIGYVNENAVDFIGREMFNSFWKAKGEYEKKIRESGEKTPTDWCTELYNKTVDLNNMNIEYWKKIIEMLQREVLRRKTLIGDISKIKYNTNALKQEYDSISQSIEIVTKNSKPTGVYLFGKHIAGCYYIAFMILLVTFLGCFAFGFFKMKEDATLANEKIRIIRTKHGCDPAVKKTFEMIDSLHTSPFIQKHV